MKPIKQALVLIQLVLMSLVLISLVLGPLVLIAQMLIALVLIALVLRTLVLIVLVLIVLLLIALALIALVLIALVMIALMFARTVKKLAPAQKNSTDISARSATFCISVDSSIVIHSNSEGGICLCLIESRFCLDKNLRYL